MQSQPISAASEHFPGPGCHLRLDLGRLPGLGRAKLHANMKQTCYDKIYKHAIQVVELRG